MPWLQQKSFYAIFLTETILKSAVMFNLTKILLLGFCYTNGARGKRYAYSSQLFHKGINFACLFQKGIKMFLGTQVPSTNHRENRINSLELRFNS